MPNEGSRREPCRTRVHGWSQVSWFRSTGNSRRFLDASSRQPARRAVPRLVSPSTSRAVPKRSQSHLALSSRALDRNYKTAVPQYWRGRIQLLLPLWAARKVVDVDLGRLGVEEWTTGSIRSRWPARWAPGSSSARSRPRRSRRHGAAVERHRVHVNRDVLVAPDLALRLEALLLEELAASRRALERFHARRGPHAGQCRREGAHLSLASRAASIRARPSSAATRADEARPSTEEKSVNFATWTTPFWTLEAP